MRGLVHKSKQNNHRFNIVRILIVDKQVSLADEIMGDTIPTANHAAWRGGVASNQNTSLIYAAKQVHFMRLLKKSVLDNVTSSRLYFVPLGFYLLSPTERGATTVRGTRQRTKTNDRQAYSFK